MRPDRYYIHVYQTKIKKADGAVCWLRSKEIAKFLNNRWRQWHYPRDRDIPITPDKWKNRRNNQGQRGWQRVVKRERRKRGKNQREVSNRRTNLHPKWNHLGQRQHFQNYHSRERLRPNHPHIYSLAEKFTQDYEKLSKTLQRMLEDAERLREYKDF